MKISSKNKIQNISHETGKTKKLWFIITAAAIPVLFFVLLELGLRLFNYGIDYRQWITVAGSHYMLNPDIARRYFYNTEKIPYSNEDLFDIVKTKNAYRVFVLGESSAAGYPSLPLGSFSRYLQKRLELLYPSLNIEIVNTAMTAINTYAIRDMMPGIIEQHPDLILIYTGHNEYYGALGAGSVESLGSNTALVNLSLFLNRLKTFQLLRNIISSAAGLFAREKKEAAGTLMSRIVKDQYIPLNSDKYKQGISQFENNMNDILDMARENKIPVIIGTLASNLKDQPPFISSGKPGSAMEIYSKAKAEYAAGNTDAARNLFRKAKDLDLLRFRGSEELNNVIRGLGKKYNYPVVEIDSVFNAVSPGGITGDNIMTDHLHPTLEGYRLIERLFYQKMQETAFLPSVKPVNIERSKLDSLTAVLNKYTRLDTLIAINRIKVLKNDWPYIKKKDSKPFSVLFSQNDYIDSLAVDVIFEHASWEKVHRFAAQWYLDRKNYTEFSNYMDVLISQYPVITEYYTFASNVFITIKDYTAAYRYLTAGYKIKPAAYFAKWIGIIDLYNGKTDSAIKFMNESNNLNPGDAQLLFNLSGAYVYINDYNKALELVNKCLAIDPAFPDAQNLKLQLTQALNKN